MCSDLKYTREHWVKGNVQLTSSRQLFGVYLNFLFSKTRHLNGWRHDTKDNDIQHISTQHIITFIVSVPNKFIMLSSDAPNEEVRCIKPFPFSQYSLVSVRQFFRVGGIKIGETSQSTMAVIWKKSLKQDIGAREPHILDTYTGNQLS